MIHVDGCDVNVLVGVDGNLVCTFSFLKLTSFLLLDPLDLTLLSITRALM